MKSKTLFRSTSIFASMTFISRILGFVRDMVIAYIFGAGIAADAFLVALKIPNFMRRLFAEGAFSQAFVPVLAEYKEQHTDKDIHEFVNRIAGSLAIALLIVTVVAEIAAPAIIAVFAPGFLHSPERFQLAVTMLHITFPYLFFISLVAFCGAIINTHGSFGPPAFTPVLFNLSLIAAALFIAPHMAQPIIGLAWGVFIAGIVQLLFLLPYLRRLRLVPIPKWGWHDPGVRRVLKLMLPALFGVSVAQINLMLDTIFASFLAVGSVSWLYYSDRLMQFPLGMFGAAIGTVILPSLSRKHAAKSDQAYSDTLDWALRSVLLVGVPSAIGLLMLAGPLLATLLHRGAFNTHDVYMARESLMAFSLGLPGFMLIKVFASGFYSRQDIKTPVKIAVVALVSNMILNLALIFPLAHAGIALATSIAGYINTGLLAYVLYKRNILQIQSHLRKYFLQLASANIAMGLLLWWATAPLTEWLQWDLLNKCLHLFIIIALAVVVYFIVLWGLGLRKRDFVKGSF